MKVLVLNSLRRAEDEDQRIDEMIWDSERLTAGPLIPVTHF